MTDQLEDLFADLRADTLTQVRPPGADAVRRTVHRRRATKAVGGAAFFALVAAGGIGSHLMGTVPSANSGRPDAGTLLKRQGLAATAVGMDPADQRLTPHQSQGVAGAGILTTGLLVAGTYTLRLGCAGPGRLAVRFRVEATPGAPAKVIDPPAQSCDDAGAAGTTTFVLANSANVQTELRPDAAAADRSGYALRLTLAPASLERLSDEAFQRVRPTVPTSVSSTGTTVFGTFWGSEDYSLAPGEYRLHFVCAGVGRVVVTTTVRGHGQPIQQRGTAVCGPSGPLSSLTVKIHSGDALQISHTADDDSIRQAAYADVLERVKAGA